MTERSAMSRRVCPEALDDLDPEDPRALRSRRDLRRIHRAMGSLTILRNLVGRLRLATHPKSIVELGAGDGTLLLRLARTLKPKWEGVELTLLDRHPAVDINTLDGYHGLKWRVNVVCEDALVWAQGTDIESYDLGIATLFLHHFQDADLRALLTGVAARTRAFIASEPRRDRLADLGSRLVAVLGSNAVTREDAIKSVAAGFARKEISAAWPADDGTWRLEEYRALPFSHCFLAARARTFSGAQRASHGH
jgi:SAM-dependent methyltransferase